MMESALTATGIWKRYGDVVANAGVELTVAYGEVLAVIGENGAGKSTLMNILYGLVEPDHGSLSLRGQPVRFRTPRDSIRAGIGMVHQHFTLVPQLTVAQNVAMGFEPGSSWWLTERAAREQASAVFERLEVELPLDIRVGELPIGSQQIVEIAKALYRGADILILDEPTSVLTPQETRGLFRLLEGLKTDGKAVIFISHKLREVLAVADRITVMRRGKSVATHARSNVDANLLASLMTGGQPSMITNDGATARTATANRREARLTIRDLHCPARSASSGLHGVSLEVTQGEIMGIAAIEGNGANDLLEVVAGVRPLSQGRITLDDHDVTSATVKERRRRGLSYVPADRTEVGLAIEATIAESLVPGLPRQEEQTSHGGLRVLEPLFTRDDTALVTRRLDSFDVRYARVDQRVGDLSGGNQQKVVVAREIGREPTCLVVAQPSRGVDIGAAALIHEQLVAARERGAAILLYTADLDELIALSDRIIVLSGGRIAWETNGEAPDLQRLGLAMAGSMSRSEHLDG